MNIRAFATALTKKIEGSHPSSSLASEAAFEWRHVIKPAWELSQEHPEIRVFTHPRQRRTKCRPTCDAGVTAFENRRRGCPKCWAHSKAPSVVDAFGTRNNFDLVAIDKAGRTLAIEVKWLRLAGGKGPNGEFQRFVGQCTLAAAVNDVVIGVCGFRGRRKKRFEEHERKVKAALKRIGVRLVSLRRGS